MRYLTASSTWGPSYLQLRWTWSIWQKLFLLFLSIFLCPCLPGLEICGCGFDPIVHVFQETWCIWVGSSTGACTFLSLPIPSPPSHNFSPQVLVASPEWGSAVKHLASKVSLLFLQSHYNTAISLREPPTRSEWVGVHATKALASRNLNLTQTELFLFFSSFLFLSFFPLQGVRG